MNMNYIRVCRGIADKGVLIPVTKDVYNGLDLNSDHYTSAFLYNEAHYKTFKETGSVAGITDTVTKKLYWDFDSENNLEQAKTDATTLCTRLSTLYGLDDSNIELYFSGMKGFQVEVNFKDETFTPNEVKNICLNIGEGLTTLDRQIYNASRVLRLPLSKHQKSGLYKTPLNFLGLEEASVDEIKEAAKIPFQLDTLQEIFKLSNGNVKIAELRSKVPKVELIVRDRQSPMDLSEVDWLNKPKFLTFEKYLLSIGFFDEGERSLALIILASTYKAQGFNSTQCYHMLKSAAEQQSDRTGSEKFSKTEIYKNIISQVYSPTWKGGQYSTTDTSLLQELSLLIPDHVRAKDESDVHDIKETGELFIQYAKDIDKNTLKFGIPCIDKNLHIQVGRLYGIIGPPGVGKTSLGISILNNVSNFGILSLFGSYDMSKYDVFQKLLQRHNNLDRDKLYEIFNKGSKEEQRNLSLKVIEQYKNVRFVFKTGQSIEELKQTILSTEKKLGAALQLIVIDYLELVQSKYSDATQSSADVIQGLREIAVNMNKAVVVFLQPNKMSSNIDEPLLSYNAAKGSSSIAQACTAILTIHRPGYSSRTPENDKYFSIDCVKNRAGKLFSADLHWDGLTGNIRELEDIERMELRELRECKREEKESDNDYIKF